MARLSSRKFSNLSEESHKRFTEDGKVILFPKRFIAHEISAELNKVNRELVARLTALQEQCDHALAIGKRGSNTGNYDGPSADSYWTHWTCPTCLKRWHRDGHKTTPN